ncbi:MAG: ethanolamine ammonia-lyase subunit EutC [Ectothiorhodospiraceae bacterium]|nr:ethanolamine ammonia-lyase subunit EutC [Ectothiorhodospiraceae bacterium]
MSRHQFPAPYRRLRELTRARVAQDTTGSSLATNELLAFQHDWAKARDAVHYAVDFPALASDMRDAGFDTVHLHSTAGDRPEYLRRPDLGRRLSEASLEALPPYRDSRPDICLVVADGLSGIAVVRHAATLLQAFRERAREQQWTLSPVILAEQGRVALGDPIGEALGARLTAMIIGERPGMTAADSLGIYLTYAPRPGRTDAERNCISNVRPDGQPLEAAAGTMAYLIGRALSLQLTGVALKDQGRLIDSGPS